MGHRDRARVAGFDLCEEHEHRGARDVRAGLRVGPRRGVGAAREGVAEDAVVGRVVLDLVEPEAPPVVRIRHRRVEVRELRVPLERFRADEPWWTVLVPSDKGQGL